MILIATTFFDAFSNLTGWKEGSMVDRHQKLSTVELPFIHLAKRAFACKHEK